jgi:hypothetical protein
MAKPGWAIRNTEEDMGSGSDYMRVASLLIGATYRKFGSHHTGRLYVWILLKKTRLE